MIARRGHFSDPVLLYFIVSFSQGQSIDPRLEPRSIDYTPFVSTQRYKLTIAYRGTHYHGWQIQAANEFAPQGVDRGTELPTVQGEVRKALMAVLGHPLEVCGSSRTDAGVHAKGQVAHIDTPMAQIPVKGLRMAVNARLPGDILIKSIEPVPDSFNAISSTVSKRYQYVIWNDHDRPNFFPELVWHFWRELDSDAMADAASRLVGTHDFASFAKPGHGRENTVRTILNLSVARRGPRLVVGVEGTGFLWNMVRIIVGTLTEVGYGRFKPQQIDAMLAAKSRTAAGSTAPPDGLYLQWIKTRVSEHIDGDSRELRIEAD